MSFWELLKQQTHARIGLKRAGDSLATQELLDFRLAYSQAKDSVWKDLESSQLKAEAQALGMSLIEVRSQCKNKQEFLLRPDRGRKLDEQYFEELKQLHSTQKNSDCLLVLADGLSASAIEMHGFSFLKAFLSTAQNEKLSLGPIVLARYARVALGDQIASFFEAQSVLVLIGERPGLASPHSLSAYYTFSPSQSTTDADRNCVSNIQERGLPPEIAAQHLVSLITQSLRKQLGGVRLRITDGA